MRITLSHFDDLSPSSLDGVLAAQVSEWRRVLSWDLSGVAAIVRESIGEQSLRGVALEIGDAIVGFAFYTSEIGRVLVGDVYIEPEFRCPETTAALTDGILGQLAKSLKHKRVEVQTICFDPPVWDSVFPARGFSGHRRGYFVAEACDIEVPDPPRVYLRRWEDSDFSGAAEVIYQSYRGGVDSRINCQYRTRDGCADLLDALTATVWCGTFQPGVTQVAVDRVTHRVTGVTIASEISEDTIHLAQISVLPVYQREGIGRAMVERAIAEAARAGYSRLTLAVTKANRTARELYERCGFTNHYDFSAYVSDPKPFRYRTG